MYEDIDNGITHVLKFLEGSKFIYGYMVDALGRKGDEGRGVTAISLGEASNSL